MRAKVRCGGVDFGEIPEVFERDGETVLLDTGSPMMVRRGGIVDRGEMFENDGGRGDVMMGTDSFGAVEFV